jgi:SAM-dependent methyltransferase
MHRGISPEIQAAVESGWFVRGGRALDAGCGEGEVAAWLAEQGFPALGTDVADAAVARARARHGERRGTLRFARLDLCTDAPDGGPFDVVVDRGCFLQLPDDDRPAYAAHLASVCAPDARLLLFGKAFRDGLAPGDPKELHRVREELLRSFGSAFEVERLAPTFLDRFRGTRADQQLPGVACWLRRRAKTVDGRR